MIFRSFSVLPLSLLFFIMSCGNPAENQPVKREPAKKIAEPQFREDGKLWVFSNTERTDTITTFRIEVVKEAQDIQYGMMFRKQMDDDMGMLFLMPSERPQSFYMRNTYVSLDIIYINAQKEVVSISEKAEPLSLKSLPSGKPALYVLEVKGGISEKLGIKPGVIIDFVTHSRN